MNNNWLLRALEKSRARGFLGPNDVAPHVQHSLGFAAAYASVREGVPHNFLDLGSGGGLPGLVLAEHWGCPAVLLDAMEKRCRFLEEVLAEPDAPQGIQVRCGRAEELAREGDLEEAFSLVVMRSFGPPAVSAECATRFLQPGGVLIVSEPPAAADRWDVDGLARLALAPLGVHSEGQHFVLFEKTGPTPAEFPRKNGVPTKKPLF